MATFQFRFVFKVETTFDCSLLYITLCVRVVLTHMNCNWIVRLNAKNVKEGGRPRWGWGGGGAAIIDALGRPATGRGGLNSQGGDGGNMVVWWWWGGGGIRWLLAGGEGKVKVDFSAKGLPSSRTHDGEVIPLLPCACRVVTEGGEKGWIWRNGRLT